MTSKPTLRARHASHCRLGKLVSLALPRCLGTHAEEGGNLGRVDLQPSGQGSEKGPRGAATATRLRLLRPPLWELQDHCSNPAYRPIRGYLRGPQSTRGPTCYSEPSNRQCRAAGGERDGRERRKRIPRNARGPARSKSPQRPRTWNGRSSLNCGPNKGLLHGWKSP
jgi:hypothetical protein